MGYLVSANQRERKAAERASLWKKIKQMRMLYLMLVLPFASLITFHYAPMYGVTLAFKKYSFKKGIMGSPWIGFDHFERLFADPLFSRAVANTVRLSVKNLVLTFFIPIIFALLLNEIKNSRFKKVVQTISYMPHFLSWVVVALVVYQVLSPSIGIVNVIIKALGGEAIYFQANPNYFDAIYITAGVWKGVGWGSIIYLAAISGVNPELYESAVLDGANRFHKAVYITIPSIAPIIVIQLILSFSGIMNGSFDAVFNLYNGLVMSKADIINTFSYRAGLISNQFEYATAIGLFQNVIGMMLVLVVNKIASKISEYALW